MIKSTLCTLCNYNISNANYTRHHSICNGQPPGTKSRSKWNAPDDLTCPFCNSIRPTKSSYVNHYLECPKNANRNYKSYTVGLPAWSKGLTKETDQRLAEAAEKTSVSLKKHFKDHPRVSKLDNSIFKNYRQACAFKFAIKNFPEEFDCLLLEQYGIYKASNRGNNLTGVSRDHMISINYGFKNKIPSKIIAHPANCQLLLHSENSKKHTKCSITLEELVERIRIWDLKYGQIV